MLRRLFVVAILAVLMFAVVGSVGAITWGQPDGNGHPNVVAILFRQQGVNGFFSCTGTLLTPYVVLTAGHCTESEGVANTATWVRNDPNIDALLASERPNYPNTTAWLNATWSPGQAVPHPQFADYAQFPNTYDIGLVLLSKPIYVEEYGAMPTLGQFDYLRTGRGAPENRRAVVVGYGLQGRIPAFAADFWERYVGQTTVINTGQSGVAGYQNFVFTNNPGQGTGVGGTCSGDSGGPAFWVNPATGEETNVVMAVNSYSITPQCNGNDYQFRTDIADALDFVNPYLGFVPN
ncbi:MAG: trypsin-like serine protease [Anaerolineae bacterium]|nr:trypsin-like serine protease [Anaerolineae bacterium]